VAQRVECLAVEAGVDFVYVDRSGDRVLIVMREGMSTRRAFLAARQLLSDAERNGLREMFDRPRVEDVDLQPIDDFLPFVSQSWLNPRPAYVATE
jgi:hypothetical protein